MGQTEEVIVEGCGQNCCADRPQGGRAAISIFFASGKKAAQNARVLAKPSKFPAFVRSLPEADLPFSGLNGWLLQTERGQVLFNESEAEVFVAEHSHGDQWGIVVEGRINLTVGRLFCRSRSLSPTLHVTKEVRGEQPEVHEGDSWGTSCAARRRLQLSLGSFSCYSTGHRTDFDRHACVNIAQ